MRNARLIKLVDPDVTIIFPGEFFISKDIIKHNFNRFNK